MFHRPDRADAWRDREVPTRRDILCGAGGLLFSACSFSRFTIEFSRVPPADKGGPDVMDVIEGRVRGAKPGQQIVWRREAS